MQFAMNNRIDDERCASTASTVSGIYSSLLASPAPVCMFYFAHPFGGIATPASTSYSIDPYAGMPTAEKTPNSKCNGPNSIQQHLNEFTPWPRQTWQSRDILSPLIQALQKQIGQNISDFEKVLRTIRELWYAPQNNSHVADIQYLHNYYSFIQRQKHLNEQNFDFVQNWKEQLDPTHFMDSPEFAANEMMMTHSIRHFDKQPDGMGTMPHTKSRKPHTGLLRRRHSLPEIIMRKHQLASQKHAFSEMNASSAPSPPAKERIPASFESRDRSRTSSHSLGSSASTIVANGFSSSGSSSSDSNLNRMFPSSGSMRQQLLRRLWHKEYRRLDRTGSLSPPLHRSFRTKRALKLQDTRPEVCLECQRLESTHFNHSVPEIAMKHIKHTSSSMSKVSSSGSNLAFPRKSYSIETETLNDRSLISPASSRLNSTPPLQSDVTSASTNDKHEMDISYAANMLNQMNGNFEDQMNGNSETTGENSFLIEMEDDRINITTMATAESTAISDTTLLSESSLMQQSSESANLQSPNQWYHHSSSTSNDGNNNNGQNESKLKMTEIGHLRGGSYEAYHMSSSEIDMENESVVRLKTHEPLDQSAIDTIISQILVDSLNNIIVVQGKGNQHELSDVERSMSQTDDEGNGNASQADGPSNHMANEMLTDYQLSSNSAMGTLPSNLVISVISGSSYPGNGGETIVHRMTDMERTESMEVQPPSAPPMLGDDVNGNPLPKTSTTIEDDDVASLVDSLDDPNEVAHSADLDVTLTELKTAEKSQAFFVPMEISDCSENLHSPAEFDVNAAIAQTMPDRLRERLEKRQIQISERKEAEMKRRQQKIHKLINQNGTAHRTRSNSKANSSSFEVIADDSPKVDKKRSGQKVDKKGKRLHSDIGSLESYTVDAQGNLKFVEGKKSNGSKKITTISGPVVKHVAIKKTITTHKPITKKLHDSNGDKAQMSKRNRVTTQVVKHRAKEATSHKTSNEKMTLAHYSPSDIITPDRECGPRRMYQKTEIREGTKRIEILEIVECLNSSPDLVNPSQSSSSSPPTNSPPQSHAQSLIERYSAKHTSKIPVPVLTKNKLRSKAISDGNQRTLKAQIRDSVSQYNGTTINNSKVDQIIADLLIEALNHSTDIGIEFIKTPQNQSPPSHIKLNSAKRINVSSRRSNAIGSGSSGRRSAHSSAKYQQIFDSIQEESGSLSFESPNDDSFATPSGNNSVGHPSPKSKDVSPPNSNHTKRDSPKKPNGVLSKVASGKAAIESDQDKSDTWFGCFGRSHIDSPVDGLLMEEAAVTSDATHRTQTTSNSTVKSSTTPTDATMVASIVVSTVGTAISNEINSNVGTAISNVSTKDTPLTSIPSEAPTRDISSVGSDSILPLLDETFQHSATGNRGGDAAKHKPFRKHARCSAQNHFDAPCSECESIENNLQQAVDINANPDKKGSQNEMKQNGEELHLLAIKPANNSIANENVWQVARIDKYDPAGKFTLSPITVCSLQAESSLASDNMKCSVDNTSFIVLHDENENTSHFLPNITTVETDQSTNRHAMRHKNSFDRPTDDCCFCNPTLHHKHRNGTDNSPKRCNFCSSRQQSTQTTPATSTRKPIQPVQNANKPAVHKEAEGKPRSSVPVEQFYESKYRSNHTHIRTHSRESDTINTQCTRKTNKKVRKTLLNGEDCLNANAETLSRRKSDGHNGHEVNGNKAPKQKSSVPKLPPARSEWHNSMESATSPSSSNSTGSSTKSNRRQDSKSVPNLPRPERWQATDLKPQKTRTNSRYQNFYGNGNASGSGTDDRVVTSSDSKSKSKPAGWTVTVAGTYSDDMAPDVQMHLSFPKRASSQSRTLDKAIHVQRSIEAKDTEVDSNSNYNDTDSQKQDTKAAILPPPPTSQSIKLNPKRSLTKNYYNAADLQQQQQQHSQLVSHRKFSFDSNGNANQRSAKEYNLPYINDRDRIIAKQTAKKTIKRSEYSVSVASATTTTRTISNFANGKRAMSIQSLNANTFQRFHNGNRKGPTRRDHSVDNGPFTYRLSGTPSPLPSSAFYSPTTIGYDEDTDRNGNARTNLSVFGNAIAPERKPPVPTMSERDVTRRHDACFTRTRSIFL